MDTTMIPMNRRTLFAFAAAVIAFSTLPGLALASPSQIGRAHV